MVTVYITSLSHGAGKTAVCAGLGALLMKSGKNPGYFKPVNGSSPDTDAAFMKQTLGLTDAEVSISPAFSSPEMLKTGVKAAFEKIAAGKDVVLIETSRAASREILPGKSILVVAHNEIDQIPAAGAADGLIINKVPVSQLPAVKVKAETMKKLYPVFGVIPEDKMLLTFSLDELARLIDGQFASLPEMKDTLIPNFMLGALTVDSALPYFNQRANKVAVLRAERSDMQLAALATDTKALVLYGNATVIPMVALRARDKKVPVITTKLDILTLTARLEETILKTKFNQPGKLARMVELMSQNIDLPAMYKMLGIS
ncbi:MAG: DRTGG domain-containing protein [Dehalococcoidales bacterium]|nr:DRTGG domain-containing protein [Dehalococcoidales bacterium]